MELEQNTMLEIAEIRHDDFWGKPQNFDHKNYKEGFVTGYQQALKDIINTMKIDRKDVIKSITKL